MLFDAISPAWLVLAIFATALLAPFLARRTGKGTGWILAIVPASAFALFLAGAAPVWAGEIWRHSLPWAPDLGIDWDLWVSPIGLLLALLVTGIGTLVAIYAGGYLAGSPALGRFFLFLFLFMGSMLGLAVTENLVVFFLFWELTSVTSFLLIGFSYVREESRKSALDALLVTGAGGVAFLAGILLLGEVGGSYRLGALFENRDVILAHAHYPLILFCFLAGALTKSAQFPFHFWLPGAMAAPAPVSAYLHSATMVKAGVFLLAFLSPLLGGTPLWHYTLLGFGTLTMTWAALVAVVQTDLKRLLAFTTVSALGTLVMLLSFEHVLAAKAAAVFLIVHAFYKGSLFMIAGVLEKTTGTRDITELNGLMRSLPLLGIAAVFAAASMSGLPPFIGFIGKELLYEAKLETPLIGWTVLICGVVANAANVVVALKVGVSPFIPSRATPTRIFKPPSLALLAGPVVLGLGSLLMGLFPQLILGGAVNAIVAQIQVEEVTLKLKLWHGFNLVLLLSGITVLLGLAGFALRRQLWILGRGISRRTNAFSAQKLFRHALANFLTWSGLLTRTIQSGNLRHYFVVILAASAALLFWAFRKTPYPFELPLAVPFRLDVCLVVLFVTVSAACLAVTRQRMTAIILLGCIGFGISALFALFGAPDLAITQLLVETLTLVLFALAIYGLPSLPRAVPTRRPRLLAIALSLLVGAGFTLLTLKALDLEFNEPVADEMARLSVPEAYGRNVVNVILVDFRALDTLGEITVLAIAALGVAAMLRSACSSRLPTPAAQPSAVLLASARFTAPAMVVFSLYLFLRGHNDPGGGFIGGLVAAMAAVLTHLARPDRRLRLFRLAPVPLLAIGLFLAILSGLPGLLVDASFLAASWGPAFPLPFVGKLKLGTPLVFDLGVYLVVAGIVLLLYDTLQLWHMSRRVRTQS